MHLDPLRWPKLLATERHGHQRYGGYLPYTHHLAAVEAAVQRFKECIYGTLMKTRGLPLHEMAPLVDNILAATWLHDIVEDTCTKVKELEELFGPEVAELVYAVTNEADGSTPYARIRSVKGATALKLADRIANVEHGLSTGRVLKKYRDKYEDFRRALYTAGEYEEMWKHLDGMLA